MKGDQDVIRKLFEKYLADACTPEEKSEIIAYFDQGNNEGYIRELIRDEFEKKIRIGEDSIQTIAEVHNRFEWVSNREKSRNLRSVFQYVRPGMAATWIAAIFCLGAIFYLYSSQKHASQMIAFTALGEKKKVELSDGSVVWLNAASKLTYPEVFTGDLREVKLEGEAFFDVTPNAKMPFVIKSGTLKTTVLGTSFNIRAYQEDKTMSVAVVTGKVKVSSSDTELHLEPNQQAVFDKRHHKLDKKLEMSTDELASWKDGMFRFRNTTFSEVTAVLHRSRGVIIKYDPRLENCPIIHADFNENDSLDSILSTLLISVNGKVEKTEDGVYLLKSTIDCSL